MGGLRVPAVEEERRTSSRGVLLFGFRDSECMPNGTVHEEGYRDYGTSEEER